MELGWNYEVLDEQLIRSKVELSDRWYQLILEMIKLSGLSSFFNEATILEVGCGMGGFCNWAGKRSKGVIGLDIGKSRLKLANKLRKSKRKVGFMLGDAHSLPFKDESYDMVFCIEALEHIPNYRRAFDELVRVTRKGGYVIIAVPNYINMTRLYIPLELLRHLTDNKPQPDDLHRFNTFIIDRLLERNDLKMMLKRGIGLIHVPSTHFNTKSIEKRLNRPLDKLKSLCINIGVIAKKIR